MKIQLFPSIAQKMYCIYQISNFQNEIVFIWWCKLIDVLKMKAAIANPAFQRDNLHTLEIITYADSNINAQIAFSNIMKERYNGANWPILNYTVQYNRLGNYICEQTGKVYYKQCEIAREIGCNPTALSNHIRGLAGFNQVKGFTFRRLDYMQDRHNSTKPPHIATRQIMPRKQGRPIQCIETGQRWESAAAACQSLGINKGQMSMHLRNVPGYKHIRGMTYQLAPVEMATPVQPSVIYP